MTKIGFRQKRTPRPAEPPSPASPQCPSKLPSREGQGWLRSVPKIFCG